MTAFEQTVSTSGWRNISSPTAVHKNNDFIHFQLLSFEPQSKVDYLYMILLQLAMQHNNASIYTPSHIFMHMHILAAVLGLTSTEMKPARSLQIYMHFWQWIDDKLRFGMVVMFT